MATKLGNIDTIAEGVVIIEDFFLGPIFDTFGRRYPVVLGFIVVGVAVGLIPMFTSLFPAYLILRCMISCGLVVSINAPLLPDYIAPKFLGRANAIIQMVICLAYLLASTGTLQVSNHVSNQSLVYYTIAITIFILSIVIFFGIKDVIKKKEDPVNDNVNKIPHLIKMKILAKMVVNEFKTKADLPIAILCGTASKLTSIVSMQYGTLFMIDVYTARN